MRSRARLTLLSFLIAGGSSFLAAQTLQPNPASLSFSARVGGAIDTRSLSVTTSNNTTVTFAMFSDQPWLKIPVPPPAGFTTPTTQTIMADPSGMNSGTYTGHLQLVSASSTVTLNVTFVVSTIGVTPTSMTFGPYTAGTVPSASQNITVAGSGTFNVTQSSSGCSWLSVSPTFGSAPATLQASLNGSIVGGLAANTYNCTISVTPTSSSVPVPIPVTLTILSTPAVTANPNTMTFNVQSGAANNITSQTLTISTNPAQALNYFVQASVSSSGPNWITFNPTSGSTDPNTGTAQITIGVNTSGLQVGNTYNGSITLSTPNGTPTQTTIPVKLNFASTPFLNVNPSSLTYTAQFGGANPADQSLSVTTTDNSATTYSIGVNYGSGASNWIVVPNSGSTASPFTVSARPASLAPGTYNATVVVTPAAAGSTQLSIPVVLTVTNNGAFGTNVSSMNFPFQIGQNSPAAQTLTLSSVTGVQLNYTVTPATTNCGSNWILLNGSANAITGSTASSTPIAVSINPAGFTAGTCTGSLTISGTNAATGVAVSNAVVNVTSVVTTTPQLVASPASISLSVAQGGQISTQPTVTISTTSSTDNLSFNLTSINQGGAPNTWLSAAPTQGATNNGNVVTVFVAPSALPAGTYNGSVTLTATTGGSTVTIPVTLQVTSGSLTVSNSSLTFNYTIGGSSPAAQTVTVGSSTSTPLTYAATVANASQTPWLSVSPANGSTNNNATLTISVDGTKLSTPGTYTGAITVNSPGSSQTINVTVNVSPGIISAPTTTLSFVQVQGGTAPAAQTVAVTGTPSSLAFTVATSTTPSGGTWLSATPASGNTPGNVSVSVSAGALGVGQYSGQVVITSTGATGSPITIPVVLNVISPAQITASPTSLNFSYTIGVQTPPAQTLTLSSNPAAQFTTSIPSNAPWLSVTPTSGTAPTTLSVSVTPGTLTAGTYNTNITISSPSLLNPLTVPVTLTVTAIPKPVINAISNAGSYLSGALSPGENVVIFGTGIGPATLATGVVSNNAFTTNVGNTRVLFDGVAAPVIYASATQTSVMVPYGVSGRANTNVVVEFTGVQSNAVPFVVVAAAPGIYTLNQAGNGPGAIINQDGVTVNAANSPEKRGNVVSVYMTGEGQTTPGGVDGAIIPPVLSSLKRPLLSVTATVGGIQADVQYAGSAAGLVSGVMQVNLVIPPSAPTGSNVPIVVSVGGTASQTGVTVAVQ
jgi:uncharacterized protein (TIGR03437 family)